MAWRHPKYRHRGFEPADPDEMNENIRQFSNEDSQLNEHNWMAGLPYGETAINRIVDRTALDVSVEAHWSRHFLTSYDRYTKTTTGEASSGALLTGPTDKKIVLNNVSWHRIMDREILASNSLLWVLASFQQVGGGNPYNPSLADTTQAQYALRVNGSVIYESKTKAFSLDNDKYGAMGPSGTVPFSLSAIIPVTSGPCKVELVSRVSDPRQMGGEVQITARELICLEFKR